ncbi:YqaJ viral recombinase family protein [Rosistilla oblonga]|uniref:YqaJ viral recombinase family protein n=1 Tax=Rosistilla oblonga TaxID=2527990 RepID=UPI003A97EC4D
MAAIWEDCDELTFPDEAAWYAERPHHLGASEIAVLLGHGYASDSVYSLYQEKIGEYVKPWTKDEQERLDRGKRAERFIAGEYEAIECQAVVIDETPVIRVWREWPVLSCTIDGRIFSRGEWVPIEMKFLGLHQRNEFRDEAAPLKYSIQLQAQMSVLGASHGILAVMFGNDLEVRIVERHDVLIEQMRLRARSFWDDHVQKRVAPDIDDSEATWNAIRYVHREPDKTAVLLPDDIYQCVEDYQIASDKEKESKKLAQQMKSKIADHIGRNTYGYFGDGTTVSWKEGSRSRQFRILKKAPKEVIEAINNDN